MKRLLQSFSAKIIVCIASMLCIILVALCAVGIVTLYEKGFYTNTYDELKAGVAWPYAASACYELQESFVNGDVSAREHFRESNVYLYRVTGGGVEIESTFFYGADYLAEYANDFDLPSGERGHIQVFVRQPIFDSNQYAAAALARLDFAWSVRWPVIALVCIGVVVWLILFVFLLCSAGRRKDPLKKRRDAPLDLCAAVFALIVTLTAPMFYSGYFVCVWVLAVYLLLLWILMQFVSQLRDGTFLHSLLISRVCRWFKYICGHIRLVPKVFICCAAFFIVACVLTVFSYGRAAFFAVIVLFYFALAIFAVFIAVLLRKLQQSGEKIADGNLHYQCDTRYMFGECRRFAGTLSRISDGVQKAVDEQLKSERFRAELITNVSHDIKTPLTSIINYIDLLKKEQKPEYLEVLDRQSQRLKKLTEDLVEASKASSGALPVNAERLDLGMLLEQTVGEFRERLQAQELTVVLNKPEQPVMIFADGRLLWRVFDNLLGNICKYAQPGTRVYLDLEQNNGKASVQFRNISKYPLNISGEELTERFVRGDRSRHTEGSGLGLSIAKNLTELQHGVFRLLIDGDLFKVLVVFDLQ